MPTEPTLRDLLEDVAAGRLEPDLAAAVLAGGGPAPQQAAPPGPTPRARTPRPQRVEILVDAIDLRVSADPTVDRVHVEGDLDVVERDDGVVELRLPTRSPSGDAYRFGAVGGLMASWLQSRPARVHVRVHPEVPVSVAATASKVEVTELVAGLNLRAAASAVRLNDVAGPLAIDLQSASAKGTLLLAEGESTIRGSMSNLEVSLLPGSDVAITMDAELGTARVFGTQSNASGTGEHTRSVVGSGAASLSVRMTLGAAKVAVP